MGASREEDLSAGTRLPVRNARDAAYNRRVFERASRGAGVFEGAAAPRRTSVLWRRVHRFSRLDPSERRLIARAARSMAAVRLGLMVMTVGALRRGLARVRRGARRERPAERPDRLARAVVRASVLVPGASCLVQALAMEALLAREGTAARLRIGFARTPHGSVAGHAWIEAAGLSLLAESGSAAHVPVTSPRVPSS